MDIFSLKWFVLGILISAPLQWFYISIRPKVTKMQFEDKLATNTITQILGLVIIVAGFTLSIYGNYLTAKAGGGEMTPDQFDTLANQFGHWFEMYVYLIWALIGIATGTGFILMIRSIWKYLNHKQTKSTNNQDIEQDIVISPKELKSTITKVEGYKKAKNDLDDFFDNIKGDKPKEK
jgi:hypothetical protein